MNLQLLISMLCLGGGIPLGGLRRKNENPTGFWAYLASGLLIYGSTCLGALLPGEWAAMLGDWIRRGTKYGSGWEEGLAWTTAIALLVGCGLWAVIAVIDVLKDKKPDQVAMSFCAGWAPLLVLCLASVNGMDAYKDTFVAFMGL